MVKKKVDARIRTLLENGVKTKHRTLMLIVGDHGRDQVVNLHYMLSKASVGRRPSVLWCYKKELGFTSHRQKRMRKIKREIARGVKTQEEAAENPFELFVGSTDIRYVYYKETHKVLGQTFGMCVLQDFPSLTPNLLARTIETVEGGGLIVMLLKSMSSLRQLYTMSMDVHSRFRTESHQDVVGRFNERFLLSLANAANTLVVDDELNILPLSSSIRNIQKFSANLDENGEVIKDPLEVELAALKDSLRDTPPVGNLIEQTRTLDQAKAVLSFMESVSEKTLRSTVVLTAGRGRGKSAALGLSIAGAVAFGYSNIFLTAPSPENLKTLFEMVFRGFDSFGYKEHSDYEVVQSLNPDFNHAIVRVNVFHTHRQTIQYIAPGDYAKLGQAELLVIDEAAAIPLPIVKNLLGPYLVFMSSTINGYEGTGRSLSLKLVKQLRQQSVAGGAAAAATGAAAGAAASSSSAAAASASTGRALREVTLDEPIRYARNDPIERWLNDLLCLDCTASVPRLLGAALPHPNSCELYYVERDTLFSSHKASENFLQRMMSLYVSSHYKNSPNDLQLMSDAPAHHLFVLLGPVTSTNAMPDILAVIQVCISQQYQNQEFASLSGARIVRIATNPEVARFGYGTRAVELLAAYYEGKVTNIGESIKKEAAKKKAATAAASSTAASSSKMEDVQDGEGEDDDNDDAEGPGGADQSGLMSEVLAPRKSLPPLLTSLQDRSPEPLHYLGVSYGLTQDLFNFWTKVGFTPLYLRLTPNELTGEHTCIMLRLLHGGARLETLSHTTDFLSEFHRDFQSRFQSLLGFEFKKFPASMALSLMVDPKNSVIENGIESAAAAAGGGSGAAASSSSSSSSTSVSPWLSSQTCPLTFVELSLFMTSFDLRRLESYSNNLVDYHLVLDLIPVLASLFFKRRLGGVKLSHTQAAILLALGLQHKDASDLERELGLPQSQVLAQFNKAVRRLVAHLKELEHSAAREEVELEQAAASASASASKSKAASSAASSAAPSSSLKSKQHQPLNQSLDSELTAGGAEALSEMKRKQRALLDGINLEQYAIGGSDEQWEATLANKGAAAGAGGTISLASSQAKKEAHREYLKNKADGAQKRASGGAQPAAKKKKQ